MPIVSLQINCFMATINHFERAIIQLMRDMTSMQLAKRVPDIPSVDYRRITYCLIEKRIAAYKAATKKHTLDDVRSELGITTKADYNWDEKDHSYSKQCKNF